MKLSIIIPVYNVENFIASCLDSIICPEAAGYEIICVNDGSTDASAAVLAEYASAHPDLIRVFTTENSGAGPSRNRGIKESRGKYLFFMDSDDLLPEGALPEILEQCENEFDVCLFDSVNVNTRGDVIKTEKGCHRDGTFTFSDYPMVMSEFASPWGKIFSRSLFVDNGIEFPARVWFEDVRILPKLYYCAKSICYVPKVWYIYLTHSGNIMTSKNASRNSEMIDAMKDVLAYFREKGIYDEYRDELCYMVFYNEFLSSSDRVNLIDKNDPMQDELLVYFLENFPDYAENPYIRTMGRKHKVLTRLLMHRRRGAVNVLLRLNNLVKLKNV